MKFLMCGEHGSQCKRRLGFEETAKGESRRAIDDRPPYDVQTLTHPMCRLPPSAAQPLAQSVCHSTPP
ncbi:hypothetical protein E3N88_02199 [Mikania micrantha]|uniref:Uncharacterized protein n=1 Tax=Mikania micrantha TaxID=192012 RepID=A0A5N6Q3M4_9ASTR|nr:hypothetical protein E3N88_02199 [Mikania micrantha]